MASVSDRVASNIKYFGSPEAYARAIQSKLASGGSLTDPEAYNAFKAQYPNLFQTGTSTASKSNPYTASNSNPYTASSNYVPLRSTFEQQGYNVIYSGNNKPVIIENPLTGERTYVTPTYINNQAYLTPDEMKNVQQAALPFYEKTAQDVQNMINNYQQQQQQAWTNYYNAQQQQISQYMQQMNNYISQIGNAGLQMLNAYQQQYSQALDTLKQYMQQDPQIPESVKVALDVLKRQTDDNIQQINEVMNERGIYNSSIAADEIRRVKDEMGDTQAQLLGQWLDQYHNQMFQAAMQMAKMQADYAGNYANLYGQAYEQPLELAMQNLGNVTNMQQQLNQEAFNQQSQLNQQMLNLSSSLRQWVGSTEEALREAQMNKEAELQKAQLQYQTELEKAALPWTMGPTPYQQGQLANQQADLELKQRLAEIDAQYKAGMLDARQKEVASQDAYRKWMMDYAENNPQGGSSGGSPPLGDSSSSGSGSSSGSLWDNITNYLRNWWNDSTRLPWSNPQ